MGRIVWRKVKRGANKAIGRDENADREVEEDVKVKWPI